MKFRSLFSASLALLLLAPVGAFGRGTDEPFDQLMLMHVVGQLATEADGSVSAVQVDTKMDADLKAAVERTVHALRFKPVLVGGQARRVRVGFDVSLAARKAAGKGFEVTIDGTQFSPVKDAELVQADGETTYELFPESMKPPGYPHDAMMAGAMGRVLLALHINGDGSVQDVAVVGSMLYETKVPEPIARRSLDGFERVAMQAARSWRVRVAPGKQLRPEGYTALAPVVFTLTHVNLEADGQWLAVKRLPSRAIPWQQHSEVNDGGRSTGLVAMGAGIELMQPARGTPVL